MKLTSKKLILLLIYSPTKGGQANAPISGRTRLTKMVFLFKKEVISDFKKDLDYEENDLPEFYAWKYGPFSKELMNDLEFLINQGFIQSSVGSTNPIPAEMAEYNYWSDEIDEFESTEYTDEEFTLTKEKGFEKGKEFWGELTKNQVKLMVEFKDVLSKVPLDRVLEYVYKKYPDYTERSLIKSRY